jgi:polysaccharide export outer membrane protein
MNKFNLKSFFWQIPLMLIFFVSCAPSHYFDHYVYLSDSVKASQLTVVPPEQHKLRVGDRIKINVTALNPLAAQQFNPPSDLSGSTAQAQLAVSETGLINPEGIGYIVDNTGGIVFPQIGHVHVEGLTTDSVGKILEQKLKEYLTDPAVSVSYINFIINILGEVSHPGPLNLPLGKNSILDAISRAGDLTIYGKRENILVIRENEGKREFGNLDLSSKDIFNSPYYYLKPGDVVYVDVNPNKLLGADTYQERRLTLLSLTFGVISTALLLINFFK